MRDLILSHVAQCAVVLLLGTTAVQAQSVTLDARTVATWADLLAVHDARSTDTTVIDSALRSRVAPLRAAAVRVIGMNRVAARYAAVRALLLTSADSTIQRDAAFALGLATDTASCRALEDAVVRQAAGAAAAWALGELGARCASFASLLDRVAQPQTRAALLRVASKWMPFPDSAVARAYARARSADERWSALYALARSRRPAGAPFAIAATRESSARMRDLGARLLAQSLQPAAGEQAALARAIAMLTDPDAQVRISAVRSASTYRNAALSALQRAWTLERDGNVRVALVQSLASAADSGARAWSDWWTSDTTPIIRQQLVAAAWQADAITALAHAAGQPLATYPDARVRVAMIEGAAAQPADRHADDIALRLADADAGVRYAAFAALARTTPATQAALGWEQIVRRTRLDSAMRVREGALRHVARGARAHDAAAVLADYRLAMNDAARDAQRAVLEVIRNAWQRDSAGFADSTLAALAVLEPPSDSLLRVEGSRIPPLVHWRRAAESLAPSRATYERIVRTIVHPSLRGRPPMLLLATQRGTVRITLDGVRAPMTSDHFLRLSRRGYFRELRFHRVVPAFVAQGGDPRGDGSGGPGYAIRDELSRAPYVRGAVGMALSGPDTGGSQFFLTLSSQPHLEGHYAVFGRVASGFTAMDALVQGDMLRDITPARP